MNKYTSKRAFSDQQSRSKTAKPQQTRDVSVPTKTTNRKTWTSTPERLDRVVASFYPELGKKLITEIIGRRLVKVSGRVVYLGSWKVVSGDMIDVAPHALQIAGPKPVKTVKFDPRWIVENNEHFMVINKPAGLAAEIPRKTDEASNLLDMLKRAFGEGMMLAHRLDRDTSGLIIALHPGPKAAEISSLFAKREVKKTYTALAENSDAAAGMQAQGTWVDYLTGNPRRKDAMIVVEKGGKHAVTDYKVVSIKPKHLFMELSPRTGRTHQLRVQCATRGIPILGDAIYGSRASYERLALHARSLSFRFDNEEYEFDAHSPF